MTTYVSGMIAPVPLANKEAYRKHAALAVKAFKRAGALSLHECWGDYIPDGKLNSMKSAVLLEEGETVVFSWIVWPSKEACEAGMQQIMNDPDMSSDRNPMPFDGKRMIFGGFEAMDLG